MDSSDTISKYIETLKPVKLQAPVIQKIVSVMDLTSLNDSDTEQSIAFFCQKAHTPYGHVAAVCVYPKFIRLVADEFAGTSIKADTVANFPQGSAPVESVLVEIGSALENGAQEIDVVFPYKRYLSGDKSYAESFVNACKAACGEKVLLKIILETNAFPDTAAITQASRDVFNAGADFIKTSTGKSGSGATLESAGAMLLALRERQANTKRHLGVKVSGGIKDIEQAAHYIELADKIMGAGWATPATFRIGASKLMDELMRVMV